MSGCSGASLIDMRAWSVGEEGAGGGGRSEVGALTKSAGRSGCGEEMGGEGVSNTGEAERAGGESARSAAEADPASEALSAGGSGVELATGTGGGGASWGLASGVFWSVVDGTEAALGSEPAGWLVVAWLSEEKTFTVAACDDSCAKWRLWICWSCVISFCR